MTVLSAQSIIKLCQEKPPLIYPLVERGVQNGKSYGLSGHSVDCRIAEDLVLEPGQSALASTIERFAIPHDVTGKVYDKSSYAREFVSCFNTLLDAGWQGYLTVELSNFGYRTVVFERGDPVCQVEFQWLDEPTERPYRGKYFAQEAGPQAARYEEESK